MILFLLFVTAFVAADYSCSFGYQLELKSTTDLNIRESYSVYATKKKMINTGTKVTYLGEIQYNQGLLWVKLSSSAWNGEAWAAQKYLTPVNPITLKVNTGSLNVRGGPCTSYGTKGTLSQGKTTGYTGIWVKTCNWIWIMLSDDRWVAAAFLDKASSNPPPPPTSSDKYVETLEKIFGHEGACQNWNGDVGNWYDGKKGYTCMGITPSVGYAARNTHFSYAIGSFSQSKELFVKYAFDLNRAKFKTGSAAIYKQNYFYICDELRQPAFYVCSDVSVNSGPGRSAQFKRELAGQKSIYSWQLEEYAMAFNQKHRDFYYAIAPAGSSNYQFLAGWLARARDRDSYVQDYCWSANCRVNVLESGHSSNAAW